MGSVTLWYRKEVGPDCGCGSELVLGQAVNSDSKLSRTRSLALIGSCAETLFDHYSGTALPASVTVACPGLATSLAQPGPSAPNP